MIRPSGVWAWLILVVVATAGCTKAKSEPEDAAIVTNGSEDPAEQAAHFDRKCVAGDLEACRQLGVMYAAGTGVSPDPRRSTALYVQACNGANLAACNALALALAEGIGVERQPQKAVDVYQKACEAGYKIACRNLGLMLRDGRGIAADLPRAQILLDKACKGNVPFACSNAGDLDLLLAAKSGAAGLHASITHYKQGCDGGDPTACRKLGIAYLDGKGVPKSTSAAAMWLERACMPDDPIACRVLGAMKVQGVGTPRDVERGKQMLTRACDAKDVEACTMLKDLAEAPSDDRGGSGADGRHGAIDDAGVPVSDAR